MISYLYVSKPLIPFDEKGLQNLAAEAAEKNNKRGVTGYLYLEKGKFVQYIEGEKEQVEELMSKIQKDPRHAVLRIFIEEGINRRRFPTWCMQKIGKEELIHWEGSSFRHEQLQEMMSAKKRSKKKLSGLLDRFSELIRGIVKEL